MDFPLLLINLWLHLTESWKLHFVAFSILQLFSHSPPSLATYHHISMSLACHEFFSFDIAFIYSPFAAPLITYLFFQLFSIIVFGCISSQGWVRDKDKEVCLYNGDSNACNYGVGISVIAFLASIGFIAGEYFFEQMSSVKTRKRYVMADMGFSGEMSGIFCVEVL